MRSLFFVVRSYHARHSARAPAGVLCRSAQWAPQTLSVAPMSDRVGGSRRGASRADAAKEKLAALAAGKASGKKRVETFEVRREEAVYDEVRKGSGELACC